MGSDAALAAVAKALLSFGVGQSAMARTLSKFEHDQAILLQNHVVMLQKAERLEQAQETLRQELAVLVETG